MKFFAVIAISCLLPACGALTRHESGGGDAPSKPGTWGHLNGGRAHWLAQLAPGSSVSVCGVAADDAASSIRDWAKVVDRDGGLAVDGDCNRQADRVVVISDPETAAVKKVCAERPDTAGLAIVDYGVILLCVPDHRRQILLHEVGHLWGLCDVYPLQTGMPDNCDPQYFTGRSRDSVMGASYGNALTGADREGLRRVAARADVAGNDMWGAPAPTDSDTGFQMQGSPPLSSSSDHKIPGAPDVLSAAELPADFLNAVFTF